MFQRSHFHTIKKRLKGPRKFIQVIYGPRQVGKTTTVQQVMEDYNHPYIFRAADAVGMSDEQWLYDAWEEARLQLAANRHHELLLVIDEIQKVNSWSEIVKKCWDEDSRNKTNIKVILLGSSRILLQQGLTESLAGRYETIYMPHWSFTEMHDAFGIKEDEYVWYGGYPAAADLIGDEDRWRNYVRDSLIESSISRDILLLTRVDKPVLMRRLFELGCLFSGQVLSYTKMLGQLTDAGNTTTLAHYLQLLDTAGLLGGIEKYSRDIIRKRASSPKFQVHNTALHAAQSGFSFTEIKAAKDEWGRVVESAVGAHLLNNCLESNMKLFYWRDGENEVDFVIEHRNKIVGIEVKSGNSTRAGGVKAFRKKFNPHKVYTLGKESINWKRLLRIHPAELF